MTLTAGALPTEMIETGVPRVGINSGAFIGDEDLITRVIRGDRNAQDEFIRRFGRLIYSILRRAALPSDVSVDDAYQQVFVQLWENDCHRLRLWRSTGRFSGYLGVIVLRVAYSYRRRPEVRLPGEGEMEAVEPDPGQSILQQETRHFILRALRHLNTRDREVIVLRHLKELSYKEIAGRTGLTVNHVGVVLARAEKRLGKRLHEAGFLD